MKTLLINIIKNFIESSNLSHPISIIINEILEISIAPDLQNATKEVIKVHCADPIKAKNLSLELQGAPIENNTVVIIGKNKADFIFQEAKLSLKYFKEAVKKRQLANQLKDFIQKLIQNPIGNANSTNINGNNVISSIDIVDDIDQINRPGHQVLKVIFKTKENADLFAAWAGNAKVINTSTTTSSSHTAHEVIVGSSRAPVVFDNLFGTLNNSGHCYLVATKNALAQKIQHQIFQDLKSVFASRNLKSHEISIEIGHAGSPHLIIKFNNSYYAKIFSNLIRVPVLQDNQQFCVSMDKILSCRLLFSLFPDKNSDKLFNELFGVGVQSAPAVITTSSTTSALNTQQINFDQEVFEQNFLVQGGAGETRTAKITNAWLGWRPIIEPEINNTLPQTLPRIESIVNKIKSLIDAAKTRYDFDKCEKFPNCITRLITDEFSFYTRSSPLTTGEYKKIIDAISDYVATIRLPQNIHLILSSFPVLWGDNTVHNSVLYVESTGLAPNIYHFSKVNASSVDFEYRGYTLATDYNVLPEDPRSPEQVLKGSKVKFDRVNQCGGSFKFFTKGGRAFITSVGICLDHAMGIERQQCKELFKQLYRNNQAIPLQISHVVSSNSIGKSVLNELAPIVHADPNSSYRIEHMPKPGAITIGNTVPHLPVLPQPSGMNPTSSSLVLPLELYPFKPLTLFYGEMLDEIAQLSSSPTLSSRLNAQDQEGNTILHRILKQPLYNFSEPCLANLQYYKHLQIKLITDLLQKGANPYIPNNTTTGETAFSLANDKNKPWLNNLIYPQTLPHAVLFSNNKRPLGVVVTDSSTSNYPPAKRIMC